MTSKELVSATYRFEKTPRFPFDLMESLSWPELLEYFGNRYGIQSHDDLIEWLDPDFRWLFTQYTGPQKGEPGFWGFMGEVTYSADAYTPPLCNASSIADVMSLPMPDPAWWAPPDLQEGARRWPDKALVYFPGWAPLFCGACYSFGMDNALANMLLGPALFDAYLARHNEFYLEILARALPKVREVCDIVWLGDDYASQSNLMFDPSLFKKLIVPHLKKQVRMIRDAGLNVLFHSCGAIRRILPDMLNMGVNSMLVFQTTADGMDAPSIAREFGGKLVFYGGIDSQSLLTRGTTEQVRAEVESNIREFDRCGGYIVANSHHGLKDIQGKNIEAMFDTAKTTARLTGSP